MSSIVALVKVISKITTELGEAFGLEIEKNIGQESAGRRR